MENKKNLKWLWITLAVVVVAALGCYLAYSASQKGSVDSVFSLSVLLTGIFVITALGYMLGSVSIKGVSLGTAGVFLVAILFGFLCSLKGLKEIPVLGNFFLDSSSSVTKYYKSVVSNVGLVMFVDGIS